MVALHQRSGSSLHPFYDLLGKPYEVQAHPYLTLEVPVGYFGLRCD